jgi:hypothetical protein
LTDNTGKTLDALYKLLIADHREEIEEIGGVVLLSKVDGKTLKIVLGVKPKEAEEVGKWTGAK